MSIATTARAGTRLTPRMAAHQLRRFARNKTVPKFATRYDRRIRRTASALPPVSSYRRISPELATFIGGFYHHSDEQMRDAAKGRFTIMGRTVDFGSVEDIDWSHRLPDEKDHHLWRMKLAQLEVLHSLVVSDDIAHHDTAVALLESFTASRNFAAQHAFAAGWSPYGASHRMLALLSGLALAARRGTLAARTWHHFASFLQVEAAFLWQNIEHDLRNNHTERNLAALCLYHMATQPVSWSYARTLDREVARIISSTVLIDGMQIERSAMYQGLTVMSLRIFAACGFLSEATRALARERGGAAARALMFLTHRDGQIALFNDSWLDEVPPPAAILKPVPRTHSAALPQAGYYRVSSGGVDALLDAGAIGPRWNPGHGHADFLAVEVDVDGRRFIVDPGTSQYSTGPQRTYERSAASHNGPRYAGVEPVEYAGCFKVGRLGHAESLPAESLSRLSVPAIGGVLRTSTGRCSRVVCALPGGGLAIVDRWESRWPPGVTNLLIPTEWHLDVDGDTEVRAHCADTTTTITVHSGSVGPVVYASWTRRYMQPEPALSITLNPADRCLAFGVGVTDPSEVTAVQTEIDRYLAGW